MSGIFGSIKRELDIAGKTITKEVDKLSGHNTQILENFKTNNVIQLVSRSSGKSLQVVVAANGQIVVDGCGPEGAQFPHTHWTVINEGNNIIRLHNQNNYLAIVGGATHVINLAGAATSGAETKFRLDYIQNFILLESHQEKGRHVGVTKNGHLKSAVATGREFDGQWGVRLIHTPYAAPAGAVYVQQK